MAKKGNRFVVVAGRHFDNATSRTYNKGDTVHSDLDLMSLFPGKFVRDTGTREEDEEIDPSHQKVVVDGGRSGISDAAPSRSSTTTSAGPVASFAAQERLGKGAEVNLPEDPAPHRGSSGSSREDREGSRHLKTASSSKSSKDEEKHSSKKSGK